MTVNTPKITLQPYGASIGNRCIEIMVTGLGAPEKNLLASVREVLSDAQWYEALVGDLHIVFRGFPGIDPAQEEYRQPILDFISELSPLSLDYQVQILKKQPQQLRPPFMVLFTSGKYYTGKDEFYENFNYVTVEIALKNSAAGKGEAIENRVHPFALVELSKHPFSTFIFKVQKKDDWTEIEDDFLKTAYISTNKARMFVIPDDNNTFESRFAYAREAWLIALDQGVRCGLDLTII